MCAKSKAGFNYISFLVKKLEVNETVFTIKIEWSSKINILIFLIIIPQILITKWQHPSHQTISISFEKNKWDLH